MAVARAGHHDAAATERLGAGKLQVDGHLCPHRDFFVGLEFDSVFANSKGSRRKVQKRCGRLNGYRLEQVGFGFTGAHAVELSTIARVVN